MSSTETNWPWHPDAGEPTNDQTIQYNATTRRWYYGTISSGGAPTDATYLVTSAHAGLSNEVVVSAYPFTDLDIAIGAGIAKSKIAAAGTFPWAEISKSGSALADLATRVLANLTDVSITAANLNSLDDGVDSTLHFHASDRARSNHTGTQLKATISDFAHTHPKTDIESAGTWANSEIAQLPNLGTAPSPARQIAILTSEISDNQVTYAKIQDISATSRILGRITAGAGDPEELTGTQLTTLLDVFTSTLKGLAPSSGGGTTNFLRADGTWAAPPAGGGGAALTRIAGNSGAAGADITWQNLTANSSDITSTTPSVVMTTTGVGAGTWKFKYTVIYQTAATGTGIGLAVNHTGTVGLFASHLKQANSIATASNGIGEDIVTAAAGNIYEVRPEVAKDTVSFKTVGVGNANTNIMAILEGIVVVTATGSLELKLSTEVSTSAVRLMADSCLELLKIE